MSTLHQEAWSRQPLNIFQEYDTQTLPPSEEIPGFCPANEFEQTIVLDSNGHPTNLTITPKGGDWNLGNGLIQLGFQPGLVKNTISNHMSLPYDGIVKDGQSVSFLVDSSGKIHISPTKAELAQMNITKEQLALICHLESPSQEETEYERLIIPTTQSPATPPEVRATPQLIERGNNTPESSLPNQAAADVMRTIELNNYAPYLWLITPVLLAVAITKLSHLLIPRGRHPYKNYKPISQGLPKVDSPATPSLPIPIIASIVAEQPISHPKPSKGESLGDIIRRDLQGDIDFWKAALNGGFGMIGHTIEETQRYIESLRDELNDWK